MNKCFYCNKEITDKEQKMFILEKICHSNCYLENIYKKAIKEIKMVENLKWVGRKRK